MSPPPFFRLKDESKEYICTLCKRTVHANDFSLHSSGRKHKKRVEDFENPRPKKVVVHEDGRKPPDKFTLHVLHRCEDYVVINKPFDLRMEDFEGGPCVVKLVTDDLTPPPPKKVWLIHRLDYATSGVLMLGLSKSGTKQACYAFEKRTTDKHYLAIVEGHVAPDTFTCEQSIVSHPTDEFKMATGSKEHPGRPACTRGYVLARGECLGQPATKLLLVPTTGRRHQLRIHTAAIGHPIVGDATYGQLDENETEEPVRMMLHAWRLRVPLQKDCIRIVSPDPLEQYFIANPSLPQPDVTAIPNI
eukprot:Rmarinus@m.11933